MRKNTAPFNWETRDEFAFREFESNLVSRVANIFEKEQGIYVLYGVRGTGKTSIKNYAQSIAEKSGFSNKNVFINIPFYTNDNDLYKYMLEQLSNNKSLEKFRKEIEEIADLFEKEISFENILSNDIKESIDRKSIEENKGEVSGGFSTRFLNFNGKKLKRKNEEENYSESCTGQSIQRSRHIPTPQDKKKKVLCLLKKIQQEFKIIIVIDELDKLSNIEIGQLVESNKMLFLDSRITILLIMDLIKGMYLKGNLTEYINDFILYRSFNFYEYIIKSENIGNSTGYNLLPLLNDYYISRGNNRELTYMKVRGNGRNIKSLCGIIYFLFQNTDFYMELPEEYQEVFRMFWGKLLEALQLLKGMSLPEYNEFSEEFIANSGIDNVTFRVLFKRFNDLVFEKKLRIADYGFYSYFDNREGIVRLFQKIITGYGIFVNEEGYFLQDLNENREFRSDFAHFLQEFDVKEEQFVQSVKRNAGLKGGDYCVFHHLQLRILRDEDVSEGVYHAQRIIRNLRNEILGVVLFYPFRRKGGEWYEKPLRNGFIYRKNIYGEIICYPYVGYIGLHSHKPQEIENFKEFLNKEEVSFYEVPDVKEGFWDECFEEGRSVKPKDILDFCERYRFVEKWLYEISRA